MAEPLELRPIGPGRWWRRRIRIDDVGVAIGRDRLAWAAVAYYLYSDGLMLYTKGGRHYFLISTNYDRWEEACERVLAELHRRFTVKGRFEPFAFVEQELWFLRDHEMQDVTRAPLARIERVVIAKGPSIEVWMRDAPIPWVAELAHVQNGLLFLDLLIERGIRVESNAPLWVPPTVRHLATVASAAVGLPRAKLRRP
jgi:hypothetical protein